MNMTPRALLALLILISMTSIASALAPMVLTHPESQMVQTGASTTLSVAVDYSGSLTYQWRKNGVDIPSSNSPTYVILNAQGTNTGSYTVVVTNAEGSCEAGPAAVFVDARRTVYVNATATGSNNGTSWANAYTSLTTALTNALDGDDIWVAAGTYKPSTAGNRDATFTVAKFVRLLGGFNGTESSLNQRNWNINVTTLSGDLSGDDTGLGGNQDDNSKRVVSVSSSSGAWVDGFTIRGGYQNAIAAPDYGAGIGIFSISSSTRVKNCAFRWNSAISYGGAIGHFLGSASSPLIVEGCTFIQNSAPANGGGAIEVGNAQLVIRESYFEGNTGSGSGAVTLNNSRGFVVVNSVFAANSSSGGMQPHVGAGALRGWSTYNANYRIYGCTMRNNTNTRGTEGAVSLSTSASSGSLFANSVVVGSGSNPVAFPISNYLLSDQTISGTGNMVGTPVFVNAALPLGADGLFGTADDGLALQPNSPGINSGSNTLVPAEVSLDAAGRARLSQQVDLGAYELPPPTIDITQHPSSISIAQNAAASFSVTATGTGTLSYQWQKDGVDIPGATGSSFTLASAKPWHIGDYTVKISDNTGTLYSSIATLSLTGQNTSIWKGLVYYFPLGATGNDNGFLANHLNGTAVSPALDRHGIASGAYSFSRATLSRMVSTQNMVLAGTTQRSVSFWARFSPTYQGIPSGKHVALFQWGSSSSGAGTHFAAMFNPGWDIQRATDGPYRMLGGLADNVYRGPFSYDQWRHYVLTLGDASSSANVELYINGVLATKIPHDQNPLNTALTKFRLGTISDDGSTIGSGGSGDSYDFGLDGAMDDVRIYNRALSPSEVYSLYANEATVQIVSQPQNESVIQNLPVSLSVTATGTGTLSYQWQKDGLDIPGATSSTYSLASAKPWHIGDYTVKVTDSNGTVTSNAAALNLTGINGGLWRGLVNYWPFSGSSTDSGVTGNHFAPTNAALAPNRFNKAAESYYFDGSGWMVSAANSSISGGASRTVSFWMKHEDMSWYLGYPNLVAWGDVSASGAIFAIRAYTVSRLLFTHGNTPGKFFGPDNWMQSGVWYHVVVTVDSPATASNTKAYINGQEFSANSYEYLEGTFATAITKFRIGTEADSGGVYNDVGEWRGQALLGWMDDIRIYNRALSAAEVTALYAAENAPNNWRQTHFDSTANSGNAADGADPDGDGLKNLLEYALNLPPNAASRAPAALQAAGGNLEYTYTRGTAAYNGGTTFQVEWSDDLTTWFTTGVVETLISDDGTHQQVKATLPAGSGGRRFVRLRVQ